MIIFFLWFSAIAPAPDDAAPSAAGGTYKTTKTMAVLEKCLHDELADLGDPTFMRSEGETILMVRDGRASPVIVEITPPAVRITTAVSGDVKTRVRRCL